MSAEIILYNAKIATNKVPSFVEAIAISDGKVTATGVNEEILSLRGPATRVIDGERRTVIPGLNDDEILPIQKAASERGAISVGYNMLRLPYAVKPIFLEWLDREVPLEAKKVRARIEMVRSGNMSDARFGSRMRGEGAYADYVNRVFKIGKKRYGLDQVAFDLTTEHFRRPGDMSLFAGIP